MEKTLSLNGSVNAVDDAQVAEALHIHEDISAESSSNDMRQVDPVELPSEWTKMYNASNKVTLLDDSLSTEASTSHVDVSGINTNEGVGGHESICTEECDTNPNQHIESEEVQEVINYMEDITNYALDEWQEKNLREFGYVEECINVDLLVSFFLQMKNGTSDNMNEKKPSTAMSTTMKSMDADIEGTDQLVERKTKSGEALRLYFVLLLQNLPLHTVAFEDSTGMGKQSKPRNTTLQGFFDAYAEIFTMALGNRPTLTTWQDVTTKFLVDACPAHQQNFFQWAHVSGSDFAWTLSETQCKRIAYVTTFQYACAALHYKHFKA